MATTTNYSWTTPDDTALVKDGAAAIRSLGTAIDSTVFTNAGAAVAKATVDAKGDLIAGTADNTVARLGVGANGTVLTADSVETTGLKWATPESGSMTVLASGAITSSTLSLTSISGSYKDLLLVLTDLRPASANYIRAKFNGATTNQNTVGMKVNSAGEALVLSTFGEFRLGEGNWMTSASNNFLQIRIYDYANTTTFKNGLAVMNYLRDDGGSGIRTLETREMVHFASANAITSIDVYPTTGNMTAAAYTLYGVK
jgi:hypothetical protein